MRLTDIFGRFFGKTKHPQTISTAELAEILQKVKHATFVSFVAETVPRCKMKGVVKTQKVVGIVRWGYKNAINNRRFLEGKRKDFEPEPRKWGQRDGTLVTYQDRLYCELKIEKVCWESYTVEGKEVGKDEIGLPEKKEGSRQGLDRPVILRDFALESITKIKMMGKEFVVKDKVSRAKKKGFAKLARVVKKVNRKKVPN